MESFKPCPNLTLSDGKFLYVLSPVSVKFISPSVCKLSYVLYFIDLITTYFTCIYAGLLSKCEVYGDQGLNKVFYF